MRITTPLRTGQHPFVLVGSVPLHFVVGSHVRVHYGSLVRHGWMLLVPLQALLDETTCAATSTHCHKPRCTNPVRSKKKNLTHTHTRLLQHGIRF